MIKTIYSSKENNDFIGRKHNMYKLTKHGKEVVKHFIKECNAKKKEILDAELDKAEDTNIPTIEDIESDIDAFIDEDGEYYNCWGITDNYSSFPLCLKDGIDFTLQKCFDR